MKVTMIGAGSLGFTRKLMGDLLSVPEFADTTFAFTDIDARNLDMVTAVCRRDIESNHLPAKIVSTLNRRKALEGADYVFSMVRVGGLEAFSKDIDIPLKYGVDQCVGDTLCAGGILYAQRTIPVLLDFCKDMREVSNKNVLFMNYSNPMAMNTWAVLKYGGVRALGLCHGVEGGHWQIAQALGVPLEEVDIICAGINHQTWYVQVLHKGRDVRHKLLAAFEKHPTFSKTEKVRIDVMRRTGYYSTESNGHLSEYVAWYRKRPNEIKRWIDLSSWINGETGGYLRVCREGRHWFVTEFPKIMKEDPRPFTAKNRSKEHGSYIVESLETGRCYRGHFNVRNGGVLTNLPADCVVEVPGYVDRNGINIPVVGDLPMACAAPITTSITVQRLAVEAAVHGDVNLLKNAMLNDPLVGAVCNPPEVWQMTDEMLVAMEPWLPQYRREIPKARERLRTEKRLARFSTKGAARVKSKVVGDMHAQLESAAKQAGRKKRR